MFYCFRLFLSVLKTPSGFVSAMVLIIMYLASAFAPFLAPYDIAYQDLSKPFHPPVSVEIKDFTLVYRTYVSVDKSIAKYSKTLDEPNSIKWFVDCEEYKLFGLIPCNKKLFGPSNEPLYILGADGLGRDVFSRLLYGAQISLSIGLIGIAITLTLGFIIGGLAGFFSNTFDFVCMRGIEFITAIPGLYLLLALRASIGGYFSSSETYIMIVVLMGFIGWTTTARVVRGIALSLRQRNFVLASIAIGQSPTKILLKHFLPNLSSYLIVSATLSVPAYILCEATLSFLGLGIQEPSASWGLMLRQIQGDLKVFMLNFWWMLLPGLAILISVVAFNVLGDAIRDTLDPKMKK